MAQIRTAFTDTEIGIIDRYRGAVPIGAWVRSEVEAALASPPLEVPVLRDGSARRRVAVNLGDDVKVEVEAAAGSLPLSTWTRDVILRRLWERGERW